jgi:hypothetical protein
MRRAAKAATGDAGASFAELIVAMTLSVLIGAMTLTIFVKINDSTAATTDRTVGSGQARNILQSWTAYLRVSDSPSAAGSTSHRFEWITATDMLFYADLQNRIGTAAATPPTMIWLRLDSEQQLVEEQFLSSSSSYPGTYGTQPSACRILATDVTASNFTGYVTASASSTDFGASLAPTGEGCINLTGSVSQTDAAANSSLPDVSSVEFDFTVTDTKALRSQQYTAVAIVPALGG